MGITGGTYSDCGQYRANNQDAVFCRILRRGEAYFALGAVCDGIGGLAHGELASGYMVQCIEGWFERIVSWIDPASADPGVLRAHLEDAAEEWNELWYEYCADNSLRSGTTMSVLMLVRGRYIILHVGDSRVYRYRERLEQLTEDETVVVMSGGRPRSYLGNYIGRSMELSYRIYEGDIEEGDFFLFCSDGLYHCLTEPDVLRLMSGCCEEENIVQACSTLTAQMARRGERDNISLGIFRCGEYC